MEAWIMIETVVLREPWNVDRRLGEIELDRSKLLRVRDVARLSASNATPFHPANAAGTFSYQDGTFSLREVNVKRGSNWVLDRSNGVEAIRNDCLKIRVIFANVDLACDDKQGPKPRSSKGAGAERACQGNLFGDDLKSFSSVPADSYATYYLMVDENGAAELTRPVIKGRTFSSYVERIYLSDGGDAPSDKLFLDDSDRVDDFDPQVVRK
jgi:hypothetical protein